MATSLVSTGVQFPDSTIQTTAATAAPSATTQYSVIGQEYYSTSATNAFTPSGLAAGIVLTNNSNGFTGAGTPRTCGQPFWSSYYNAWFSVMAIGSGSLYGAYISKNGLDWVFYFGLTSLFASYALQYGASGASPLTVDDSNGRFFYTYTDNSQLYVAYSDISSTGNLNNSTGWTTISLGGAYYIYLGGATYCKMATTGASGIVVWAYWQDIQRVYTCPAGSTTFTLQFSVITGINTPGNLAYQENGSVCIPVPNSQIIVYNTSGNIHSGWTSYGSLSSSPSNTRQACVANGYMAYLSGSNVSYSANGTTWSDASGLSNVFAVTYTGSVWVAWNDQVSYASASGVPASFSIYSGGVNAGRYPTINTRFGRRVVA